MQGSASASPPQLCPRTPGQAQSPWAHAFVPLHSKVPPIGYQDRPVCFAREHSAAWSFLNTYHRAACMVPSHRVRCGSYSFLGHEFSFPWGHCQKPSTEFHEIPHKNWGHKHFLWPLIMDSAFIVTEKRQQTPTAPGHTFAAELTRQCLTGSSQ